MSFEGIKSVLGLHDPAELASRMQALKESEARISADLQVLESDIDGFDSDGYDYFRTKVLPKELDRLAHQCAEMDESPKNRDARIEVKGRYKQVKAQMTQYAVLASRRSALRDELRKNLKAQAEIQEEIERDQKRRAI